MEFLILAGALAMMLAVELFNRRAIWGKAVVATANDSDAAGLMGAQRPMVTLSYAISSMTAAFAGVLIAPGHPDRRHNGISPSGSRLLPSIIGGLTSGLGVIVGGILLGISEKMTGYYFATGYADVPGLFLCCWCWPSARMACLANAQSRKSSPMRVTPEGILVGIIALCAIALPLPAFGMTNYYVHLGMVIAIYSILLLGLDIVVGYTGGVSLGHAALFGIGAYTAGVLLFQLKLGLWIALPASMMVAALFGLLLALPALKVTGPYLAMVTLAFGTIVQILINEITPLTNGPMGIKLNRPFLLGYLPKDREYFSWCSCFWACLFWWSIASCAQAMAAPFRLA